MTMLKRCFAIRKALVSSPLFMGNLMHTETTHPSPYNDHMIDG
jgi:hypothetical protein